LINPFHELYVGERISSREFVSIFSTALVEHAAPLFIPGNVVLAGVQGSGKSMLFKLLHPEVRQEYANAREPFPVPHATSRFIGAGINLNTSEATQFGLRSWPNDPVQRGLLFGDFFNYVIAVDLLKTVETLANGPIEVAEELGIRLDEGRKAALAEALASDDVWYGYLSAATCFDDLRSRMTRRLAYYRQFMHGNRDALDESISQTKTGVGEPISAVARTLKSCGVVPNDVNVFIHVDQYEEIGTISTGAEELDYRSVVNRAINRRDPAVSYRIGTRAYAWHQHARIFGTSAKLEQERDYKFIDLDEKLRRHEDRASWIFPAFARDVFTRRVRQTGITNFDADNSNPLLQVLGQSISAELKAKEYAGKNPERVLRIPRGWPDKVADRLRTIARADPLSARLGEAWIRQKGVEGTDAEQPPWETRKAQWWKKERIELALAQIASSTQQRPIWSGEDDVIGLSGGNILAFLSICQLIWDLACQTGKTADAAPEFPIRSGIQSIGILKASEYWLNKILQEFGNSGDRFKLVRHLGKEFSREMLNDRKMSYPGHNGFSVKDAELESNEPVHALLVAAGEFGNLLMLPHTTKERDRAPRTKWYLSPIYCPYFRLPFNRTKEPIYAGISEVEDWMIDAGIFKGDGKRRRKPQKRIAEAPLFEGFDD
jgi:hypothetical protein